MEHHQFDSDSSDDEYFSAGEGEGSFCVVPTPLHSVDGFHLYGIPQMKRGESIGVVGDKLIGKTTLLNLLAGNILPNLCKQDYPPEFEAIVDHLAIIKDTPGAKDFLTYLTLIRVGALKVSMKTQDITQEEIIKMQLQKTFPETVEDILARQCQRNQYKILEICSLLGIDDDILCSFPHQLSKNAIQKVKMAVALLKKADVYIFDNPSSHLSWKERLGVADGIISVIGPRRYVVIADQDVELVEHVSNYVFEMDGVPNRIGLLKPVPYLPAA